MQTRMICECATLAQIKARVQQERQGKKFLTEAEVYHIIQQEDDSDTPEIVPPTQAAELPTLAKISPLAKGNFDCVFYLNIVERLQAILK